MFAFGLTEVMQALEAALLETAGRWEQDGVAAGEVREIIGAVDETFLEQMILVFLDVPTGYLVQEEVADDRTYATWKAVVEARLTALGAEVWYLVSDRAKAFIQLAEQGLECLSMPDLFHCMHDLVKSYALAIGQRVRQAHHELTKAQETLARRHAPHSLDGSEREARAIVEARQGEVTRWEEVRTAYRDHLETLSLTLPPFRIADSAPQTSAQVASQLQATLEAIDRLGPAPSVASPARRHDQGPQASAGLGSPRRLVVARGPPGCGAVVLSPRWRQWVDECLLPMVYWGHQVTRTRCARRKAKMQAAWAAPRAAFDQHAITQRLTPECWRSGKRGLRSGRRPFSGPPRLWKAATGICRRCTITSEVCPGADTRCGRSCTTLIVALRMARRRRRAFSADVPGSL